MIVDINKKEIKVGSNILVHQDEEVRKAVVVDLFPDEPTTNEKGFWVDIRIGKNKRIEGMMSYILEVV